MAEARVSIIGACLLCWAAACVALINPGAPCVDPQQRRGVCCLFGRCPIIREEFTRGVTPSFCGFYGREPLVCCPHEPLVTSTTTPLPIPPTPGNPTEQPRGLLNDTGPTVTTETSTDPPSLPPGQLNDTESTVSTVIPTDPPSLPPEELNDTGSTVTTVIPTDPPSLPPGQLNDSGSTVTTATPTDSPSLLPGQLNETGPMFLIPVSTLSPFSIPGKRAYDRCSEYKDICRGINKAGVEDGQRIHRRAYMQPVQRGGYLPPSERGYLPPSERGNLPPSQGPFRPPLLPQRPDPEVPVKISYMARKPIEYIPTVSGGTRTIPDEFPHMAAIGYGSENDIKYYCGGSLISEKFVLTAAHCLHHHRAGEAKWVLLGTVRLVANASLLGDKGQIHEVVDRKRHPDYERSDKYNDIGLIEIGPAVTPNARSLLSLELHPACLAPFEGVFPHQPYIATGWGVVGNQAGTSDDLLKVELDLIDEDSCNEIFESGKGSSSILKKGFDSTLLCAGDLSGGKGTCIGDSGGPLQTDIYIDCLYNIRGVTSFGLFCGLPDSPSVYTNVLSFIEWIEDQVWPIKQ